MTRPQHSPNDAVPRQGGRLRRGIRIVEIGIAVLAAIYLADFWLRRMPRLRREAAAQQTGETGRAMQVISDAVPDGAVRLRITDDGLLRDGRKITAADLAAAQPEGGLVVLEAGPDTRYERVWAVAQSLMDAGFEVALPAGSAIRDE